MVNLGGLGTGSLLAGVLAEHLGHPTLLPYLVHLVLLLPVLLVFAMRVPETVRERDGWRAGARPQRLGVPPEIRVPFVAAALAALASFSVLGFSTALAGQVLAEGLHDRSHQTVGVVAFVLLGGAVAGQVLAGRVANRTANLVGLATTPVGVLLLVLAVVATSLPLLVVAVVVAGLGVGFAFRASLGRVVSIAPDDRRGEVTSAYFAAAYPRTDDSRGRCRPAGHHDLVAGRGRHPGGVRRRAVRGRGRHRRPHPRLRPARLPGMVLEVALIQVLPGQEDAFAAAYLGARELVATTPGCRSVRMTRGVESPSRFVLLVEWDSVEAHEQNFRGTDRFTRWRAAIGPFFDGPPDVQHAVDV